MSRSRLAAVTVVRCAAAVLAAGPPPEGLLPLLGPLDRLHAAVLARDEALLRSCAREVADQPAVVSWACDAQRPAPIRELGAALAWLAVAWEAAGGGAADLSA